MTTGRINQVTILTRRPKAKGHPPKEAESSITIRHGRAEAHPAASAKPAWAGRRQATDSIAPTEFPKGRSAAREIGP